MNNTSQILKTDLPHLFSLNKFSSDYIQLLVLLFNIDPKIFRKQTNICHNSLRKTVRKQLYRAGLSRCRHILLSCFKKFRLILQLLSCSTGYRNLCTKSKQNIATLKQPRPENMSEFCHKTV